MRRIIVRGTMSCRYQALSGQSLVGRLSRPPGICVSSAGAANNQAMHAANRRVSKWARQNIAIGDAIMPPTAKSQDEAGSGIMGRRAPGSEDDSAGKVVDEMKLMDAPAGETYGHVECNFIDDIV